MSATVPFADIRRMLDECAKGHTLRLATHSYVVTFNRKTYRSLPKFQNIEVGHVRKMVRYLEINWDCAAKYL